MSGLTVEPYVYCCRCWCRVTLREAHELTADDVAGGSSEVVGFLCPVCVAQGAAERPGRDRPTDVEHS